LKGYLAIFKVWIAQQARRRGTPGAADSGASCLDA
jgi:hypothetical protein